jgi:hypothetical protein
MSNTLLTLSAKQLAKALRIREKIETLEAQLSEIVNDGGEMPVPFFKGPKKRKGMSAAGRRAVAAAQKARWAKINESKDEKPAKKPERKMSAAARAKIAAVAKARWAAAKKAGKKTL